MSLQPDEQPKQRRIPFTREARFALLKSIKPEIAGVTRRTWINIAELLTQVELCTGRDGCFAYCETLYDRMFGGRGIPRSTFFRVRRHAGQLGLLLGEERYVGNGKTSNEWRVAWDQVGALAARSGTVLEVETPRLPPGAESGTDRFRNGTDRRQSGTDGSRNGTDSFRGIVPSSVSTTVPTLRSTVDNADDQKNGTKQNHGGDAGGAGRAGETHPPHRRAPAPAMRLNHLQQAAIRELAERIERGLGCRCRVPSDWRLAVKAAMLSAFIGEKFGEDWLWDSVTAVVKVEEQRGRERKRPLDNRWSYLHRCLQEATRKRHKTLNRELAKFEPPAELLRYDGAAWKQEARLCQGGEL